VRKHFFSQFLSWD